MNKLNIVGKYEKNQTANIIILILLYFSYIFACYYNLTLTFALMPYYGFSITGSLSVTSFWIGLILMAGIAVLIFEFFLKYVYRFLCRSYAGKILKEYGPEKYGGSAFMAKIPEFPIGFFEFKFWVRVFFILLNVIIGCLNFIPMYYPVIFSFYIVIKLIVKLIVFGLMVIFLLQNFCKSSNRARVMSTFPLILFLVVILVF